MDPRIVAALDTETYFDSELSVRRLGNVPYATRTDWFLVSLYSPTLDLRYCGPPEEAPWDRVDGQIWISHNAAFDSAIFHAGQQRGQVPSSVAPSRWHCSADLSAYSLLGRALATAVQNAPEIQANRAVNMMSPAICRPDRPLARRISSIRKPPVRAVMNVSPKNSVRRHSARPG